LKRAPSFECEVLERESWSAREAQSRVPPGWAQHRKGPCVVSVPEDDSRALAEALLSQAENAGLAIKRLSVRRSEPQFQIHVGLPKEGHPAGGFFAAVRGLAERVLG
jgi:hypothetical protein